MIFRALEEVALHESLDDVIVWFKSFALTSIKHQVGDRYTPLISQLSENGCLISDQLDIISSLKESAYYKSISDVCALYESKLMSANQITEKINEVQRRWLHLEPIYSNGVITIKQDLFQSADTTFRSIMMKNENPSLNQLVDEDVNGDLCRILDILIMDLDQCQLCLFHFLEEKRFQFPRLYFLGDESLLDILAHPNEPQEAQIHIKHIFQAIQNIELDPILSKIIAFKSEHEEKVILRKVCLNYVEWCHFYLYLLLNSSFAQSINQGHRYT